MALTTSEIANKLDHLRRQYATRDTNMNQVLAVREGKMAEVYPDLFPEGLEAPMVANFIDVAARDVAELLAPLPSFNCATADVTNDKKKKAAEKRTKIANHYVSASDLESQMYYGADWYNTYGMVAFIIEPHRSTQSVRIRVENPMGAYPEYNLSGRCVSYSKVYKKTVGQLIAEYPEYVSAITRGQPAELVDYSREMELVKYYDKDQVVLYMPDVNNLVLERYENPIKRVPVIVPKRPSLNEHNPRGQFDDVIWVQIARARFAMLAMEAAEKSVQAPLAVPNDVDDFAYGPDAIIRTNNPGAIRRVGLELPTGAFTEQQVLAAEMRLGARYPEGRSGTLDASIITGQGVQALLGAFDSQIKAAQQIFSRALEEVVSVCFEMDEALFPVTKTSEGVFNGAPYSFEYNPAQDVKGDYTIQARYGLMAGLDPSRALIFSLQALQAKLVSREFIMQELPWPINVSAEIERIEIEEMRGTLAQGLLASVQALPQMVATGQGDPSKLVTQIADVIDKRKQGVPIEQAILDVFQPPAPPEVPAGVVAPVEQGQAAPPMGGQSPEQAPPQGEQPQGTPPNAEAILARLRGQ
jgi:hypothetical protein